MKCVMWLQHMSTVLWLWSEVDNQDTQAPFLYWHWLRLPGLGNNNEKLGLPERLSAGIQFRFRNLFHEKISGNRNFICLYVASISKTSGNFSNIFLIISSWKDIPFTIPDSFANTSTVAPAKKGFRILKFEEVTFRASHECI